MIVLELNPPRSFLTANAKNVYHFVRVLICNGNLRGAALQSRCVPLTRTRRSKARQSARVLFRRLTSSRLLLERDFFCAFTGELCASFCVSARSMRPTVQSEQPQVVSVTTIVDWRGWWAQCETLLLWMAWDSCCATVGFAWMCHV